MKSLALLLLVACGDSSSTDWTKRKVVSSNETIDGVAFSIELPEGMRKRVEKDQLHWDFHEKDRVFTPDVEVSPKAAFKTAADFLGFMHVQKPLRNDALPDGFVIATENPSYPGKEDYLIYAMRGPVGCMVRVAPWSRGEDVKAKLGAAAQLCLSIKYQK